MNVVKIGSIFTLIIIFSYCNSADIKAPIDIYGTWEIYKCVSVGGHAPDNTTLVNKSIGTKVVLGKDYMSCTKDSFVAKKGFYKQVRYKYETRKYKMKNGHIYQDGYDEGSLAFYGIDGAYVDKTIELVIDVKDKWKQYLEVTNKGELVIYGDGYFVFMRRTSKTMAYSIEETKAIEAAKKKAIDLGYDVKAMDVRIKENGSLILVYFALKGRVLGGDLTVKVDPKTGSVVDYSRGQ